MKSERFRIAEKFRSEGQGESSRINGEKERGLKTIQSEAFRKAEIIMGQADARAAAISREPITSHYRPVIFTALLNQWKHLKILLIQLLQLLFPQKRIIQIPYRYEINSGLTGQKCFCNYGRFKKIIARKKGCIKSLLHCPLPPKGVR